MPYKEICQGVAELSRAVGQYIREERRAFQSHMVEAKGLHNYVSHVDREAERRIVEGLRAMMPQAGFMAEEGSGTPNPHGYNWVIDPLDGTTNFIHGLPPYAISIALMRGRTLVMGVIYEIVLGECFYSWGQGEAFLNGQPIRVSSVPRVSDSLIATGFPYYDYDRLSPFLRTMEHFMHHSHGLRRLGSAATDLAYVACGRFEAFYEYGLNPWDVAAGAFLIQQAGGRVSDFAGGDNFIHGREIIAANAKVFDEFREAVARIMNNPHDG